MQTILTVFQVFLSLGLIGLILIQHGKGADAGAAFGSGASQTVFGSQGSGSFLSRTTAILATLFFLTSMAMAYFAARNAAEPVGLMDDVSEIPQAVELNAAPQSQSSDVPAVPAAESMLGPASDVPALAAPMESAASETAPVEPEATPEAKNTEDAVDSEQTSDIK